MNTSRRASSSKKGLVAFFGLTVLVVAGWLLVWPKWGEIGVAKQNLQTANNRKQSQQAALAGMDGLINDFNAKKQQLAILEKVLPDNPATPQLLANIEAIVKQSGMRITALKILDQESNTAQGPSTGGLAASRDTVESTPLFQGKKLAELNIDLGVIGSFDSFYVFLELLEKNMRLFEIKSFAIKPVGEQAEGGTDQTFDLVLVAYYQK